MEYHEQSEICTVLSVESRWKILQILQRSKRPCDIVELAKKTGLHPNVVRYHLNLLESISLVKSFVEKEQKSGRPRKVYIYSGKYVKVEYPTRQFMFLSELLCKFCTELHSRDEIEHHAFRIGYEIGRMWMKEEEDRKRLKKWTIDECADSVMKILTQLGLDPELLSISENGFSWQARNCIFSELSKKYPFIPCSFHIGILNGLIEHALGKVDLVLPKRFAIGDNLCKVIVKKT